LVVLINVYANQNFKNRANLWKAISNLDIDMNHWIVGGDFNMLETMIGRLTRKNKMGLDKKAT
jgi:hypothetical protein